MRFIGFIYLRLIYGFWFWVLYSIRVRRGKRVRSYIIIVPILYRRWYFFSVFFLPIFRFISDDITECTYSYLNEQNVIIIIFLNYLVGCIISVRNDNSRHKRNHRNLPTEIYICSEQVKKNIYTVYYKVYIHNIIQVSITHL